MPTFLIITSVVAWLLAAIGTYRLLHFHMSEQEGHVLWRICQACSAISGAVSVICLFTVLVHYKLPPYGP